MLRTLVNRTASREESPLSLFYDCDREVSKQLTQLNQVIIEHPDDLGRRSQLMTRLKESQNNLMDVVMVIIQAACPDSRARRDYRMKYPDDILLHQLNGPIWFGAECLAAGSYIAHREAESDELRPFAAHVTECIHRIRLTLRSQGPSLGAPETFPESLKDLLRWFDHTWAEFEFRYVSIMCPVLSTEEFDQLQEVIVCFIESTKWAIKNEYITEDMMDMMDPSLMFAIPRLAIVWSLTVSPNGALDLSRSAKDFPYCFRPYRTALENIKKRLKKLSAKDVEMLLQALCSSEGLGPAVSAPKETPESSVSAVAAALKPVEVERSPSPAETSLSSIEQSWSDASSEHPAELVCAGDSQQQSPATLASPEQEELEEERPSTFPAEYTRAEVEEGSGKCVQDTSGSNKNQEYLQQLFLSVCSVADQLQSKCSKEMRTILKHVFYACQEEEPSSADSDSGSISKETTSTGNLPGTSATRREPVREPPSWVSDVDRKECHSCLEPFNFFRRRHHCRNCGEVVCSKCSPYSIPLPKFGYSKPVRICSICYIAHVNNLLHPEATPTTAQ